MGLKLKDCLAILCGNSSTIKLSKNLVIRGRSNHINVRFHFLSDLCKTGFIELKFCSSQKTGDLLTKPLKNESFQKLRSCLGIYSLSKIENDINKLNT